MNEEQKGSKPTRGGATVKSKQSFYAAISEYTQEAIDFMVETMRNSRNESLKFGAARAIIDKTIPDLKSVELGGELDENGKRRSLELFVNVGGGFLPATVSLPASPVSSSTGITTQVQSTDLASESEKDLHSDNGDIKAGTS